MLIIAHPVERSRHDALSIDALDRTEQRCEMSNYVFKPDYALSRFEVVVVQLRLNIRELAVWIHGDMVFAQCLVLINDKEGFHDVLAVHLPPVEENIRYLACTHDGAVLRSGWVAEQDEGVAQAAMAAGKLDTVPLDVL